MPNKKDSELCSWLTGQWGKRLGNRDNGRKLDNTKRKPRTSRQPRKDWIDEMVELDEILYDD